MTEPVSTHPYKLSFLLFSALIAACLMCITYLIATLGKYHQGNSQLNNNSSVLRTEISRVEADYNSFTQTAHLSHFPKRMPLPNKPLKRSLASLGGLPRNTATFFGHVILSGTHIVAHTTNSVTNIAVGAVNINTYIKSTDHTPVPTITPLPAIKVATSIPLAYSQTAAPAPIQSQQVATVTASAIPLPPFLTTNTYAWGNCTYWAAKRRAQTGNPIPNSWGNAATWATRAAQDGYVVNHRPSSGAIMQTPYSAGGLGHVAFVESVDPNGTWHISEMNVIGLDKVDDKSLPLSVAARYNFIHNKI